MLEAREHEPLDLPVGALLDEHGKLQLSEDAESAGYFAAHLPGDGRVRLQPTGWIGLIPLSETVLVNVKPRVPISNLARLLRISEQTPRGLIQMRAYATGDSWNASLLDLYTEALLQHLGVIFDHGLMKTYIRREEQSSFPRGRVLMTPTATRIHARGVFHRAQTSYFERTSDNAVNRCLKYALFFLASRYAILPRLAGVSKRIQRLNSLYGRLQGIEIDHSLRFLDDPLVTGANPLPALRGYYRDALDVAVAIIRQHAVLIEAQGDSVRLPSFVLNMNHVFEGYLRNVLSAHATTNAWPLAVLDGNTDGKKPLFDTPPSELATPDIVLREPGGETVLVIEVKNVPTVNAPSRDRINQALGYALTFRCPNVVIAQPRGHDDPKHGLHRIGSIDGTTLYQYVFDGGAVELSHEEQLYGSSMGALAGAC